MIVTHLSLADFRNYAAADVELRPGANLFVGRNGQGKTNLVESVGYLSTLGSHRVSSDKALIRAGADSAVIRARLRHGDRSLLAEVQINRSSPNRAQVNRAGIKPRELPRYVASVLFAPEDLVIVRGDPGERRRFLDQLLVQRAPRLSSVLSDYDRALKQRNTLLKSARSSGLRETQLSTLEVWDDKLVSLGSVIIAERARLVAALAGPLEAAYEAVVDADHGPGMQPVLSVAGSDAQDDADGRARADDVVASSTPLSAPTDPAAVAERFRSALAERRRSELERGLTLVGPHRDDVLLTLNDLPVKGYASHGESWSFALALKLAAARLLRSESSLGDPVLILDDVFAELDRGRRSRLATAVGDFEQVLITAAVLEDVPEELTAHTVHIVSGRIVEDGADAAAAGEREAIA